MSEPRFSVIVPTFRRDELLRRALHSLLAQTFADFEIIVADNADSDSTRALIDAQPDQRLRCIVADQQQGPAHARNRGLDAARGKFICFVDDDDEVAPEFLEALHAFLDSASAADVDFCWTAQTRIYHHADGSTSTAEYRVGAARVHNRSFVLRIGAGGLCVPREALRELGGFNESMQVSEDRDLVLRLLEAGYRAAPLDQPLYIRHYDSSPQLSRSLEPLEDARHDLMLLEAHRAYIDRYPRLRDMLLDQLGQHYLLGGDLARALDIAWQAYRLGPLRPKAARRLLKCYLRLLGERIAPGSRA